MTAGVNTQVYLAGGSGYIPFNFYKNGVPVADATGLSFSVVPDGNPVGAWTAAAFVDGLPCAVVSNITAGVYRLRAQIVTANESWIVDVGKYTVTT